MSEFLDELYIPLRIHSEANLREHWRTRVKRKKEMKRAVIFMWRNAQIRNIKPPVVIKLVRQAPRRLDDDNLVAAFKTIRDAVADLIIPGLAPGRADDKEGLQFSYEQEKSKKYGVRIEAYRPIE
jgi:hypothetical protein